MSNDIIPGAADQGLGLTLPGDLPRAQWREIGRSLAEADRRLPWMIADWANYGAGRWGDTHGLLIETTGLAYQTACNMATVARAFEFSRRRENLSFGHHSEVAALEPPDQDALLDQAVAEGWPVRALRTQVARFRRGVKLVARQQASPLDGAPVGSYAVIYADPPWTFVAGQSERAASAHYPVMTEAEISALPVAALAAPDAVLFLWATAPCLEQALRVLAAWGFTYSTHVVWRKDRLGTGYRVRSRHEPLLIGTRGDLPAPAPGTQPESVVDAPRAGHSAKPAVFRDLIDAAYPDLPRIELFARGASVSGWDVWGNEAGIGTPDAADPDQTGEAA